MKSYAVLRAAKLKTVAAIATAANHNMRRRPQLHAANARPLMGGGVRAVAGDGDPTETFHRRLRETGVKPRKGAVLALEFVASASSDWFRAATPSERKAWAYRTLALLTERVGGESNLLGAWLHDDEECPHLHVLAVPLIRKARKPPGRPRRSAAAESRPGASGWALAAADIIGSAQLLAKLQTDYAEALVDLGIRRGRPRSMTGATHKSPSVYRAEVAAFAEQEKAQAVEAAREIVAASAREHHQRQAEAMTAGFDAVERRQIVYAPSSPDVPRERLMAGPEAPQDADAWRKLVELIRPAFRPVPRYAEAMHRIFARETALVRQAEALRTRETDLAAIATELAHLHREGDPLIAARAQKLRHELTRPSGEGQRC